MNKRPTLLLLPLCILLAIGCKKKDHNGQPPTTLAYAQTQCADRWGYGSTDAETISKLTSYFIGMGYPVGTTTILPDGEAELCNACACKTGKTIYVQVSEAYVDEYKAYGFTE